MFKLGEKQELAVCELTEHGAYLTEGTAGQNPGKTGTEKVLLPGRYLPEGTKTGDRLTVFLYKDSEDRLIATTLTPLLVLHQVGHLTVRETSRIGAFLDWGLAKDLFLPFAGQTKKVKKGESVLCAPIIDKSGRLCAVMNVYPYLEEKSPYQEDDHVSGTAYETSDNFGVFVAVDDRYSALIPKKELVREVPVGEHVEARVAAVLPDGRLSLSLREKGYLQMEDDAEILMAYIARNGKIPFTDHADPEEIRETFSMSKNQFKRAVGRLLKEGRIILTDEAILPGEKA
ncbi:MAG: RNA-binding protein [Lachnospiraceae bacterium]|nr:RNA-binding protein [Lachnospiraceae bacterium]